MELGAINSPAAALVAGLITSLHCAGMCGPLACSLMPGRGEPADAATVGTVYHVTRLSAYAMLGAIAGGAGGAPLTWFAQSALRGLPWIMVLFFLGLALRWDRFLPRLGAPGQLALRVQRWGFGRSRLRGAALLGLATPLLPCGPLYFLVTLALFTGSALRGAEFMLAFGAGTLPLLWLVQSQYFRLRDHVSPRGLERLRVGLALTAALVIAWRLRATLGFAGPDPASFLCT
ncbi:MAG: sulfite exporter TauE/SafE family protein [Pseudomonadota bacterium]